MSNTLNKINTFIQTNNNLSSIIDYCREYKSKKEINIYLVGGIIRDILLDTNEKFIDIDIVIDGDIDHFSNEIANKSNFNIKQIHNFPNYKLSQNNGLQIDIAHTRKEKYQSSGSLPDWTKSTIKEDLYRRDFSINSIALEIKNDCFQIIDPINGIKDINNKIIKILHKNSFIDDPTRILRAIRYKARLQFNFDEQTKSLFYDSFDYLKNISLFRKNNEIIKLLNEPFIENFVSLMNNDKRIKLLFPNLFLNKINYINKNFWNESNTIEKLFFALFSVNENSRDDFLKSLNFPKNELEEILYFYKIKQRIEKNKILDPNEITLSNQFLSNLYHCL